MRSFEAAYEIWSKHDKYWEFEAGSNSFEGAMQFAKYLMGKPKGCRVIVYLGDKVAYDSDVDGGECGEDDSSLGRGEGSEGDGKAA